MCASQVSFCKRWLLCADLKCYNRVPSSKRALCERAFVTELVDEGRRMIRARQDAEKVAAMRSLLQSAIVVALSSGKSESLEEKIDEVEIRSDSAKLEDILEEARRTVKQLNSQAKLEKAVTDLEKSVSSGRAVLSQLRTGNDNDATQTPNSMQSTIDASLEDINLSAQACIIAGADEGHVSLVNARAVTSLLRKAKAALRLEDASSRARSERVVDDLRVALDTAVGAQTDALPPDHASVIAARQLLRALEHEKAVTDAIASLTDALRFHESGATDYLQLLSCVAHIESQALFEVEDG